MKITKITMHGKVYFLQFGWRIERIGRWIFSIPRFYVAMAIDEDSLYGDI